MRCRELIQTSLGWTQCHAWSSTCEVVGDRGGREVKRGKCNNGSSLPKPVIPYNGKWKICVNFTSLNQDCLKNYFPLPKIDHLVDSTLGHARMSFLDTYQGYQQIALHEPDREKTAFFTFEAFFCYNVISLRLMNTRATYQRMITKIFGCLMGNTI